MLFFPCHSEHHLARISTVFSSKSVDYVFLFYLLGSCRFSFALQQTDLAGFSAKFFAAFYKDSVSFLCFDHRLILVMLVFTRIM